MLGQSAVHGAFAGYTGFTPGLLNTCARRLSALHVYSYYTWLRKPDDSLQLPNNVFRPYRHYVFLPIPVIIQVCVPLLPFLHFMPGAFLQGVCLLL